MDYKKYITDNYGAKRSADISDNNDYCDWLALVDHKPVRIEFKERTDDYDDILFEAWQSVKRIKETDEDLFNITPKQVHVAVGWFYKCDCDRFVYVMKSGVAYDFDWKRIKEFVLNNLESGKVDLQYSDKTTGAYNYKVKITDIPADLYVRRQV